MVSMKTNWLHGWYVKPESFWREIWQNREPNSGAQILVREKIWFLWRGLVNSGGGFLAGSGQGATGAVSHSSGMQRTLVEMRRIIAGSLDHRIIKGSAI